MYSIYLIVISDSAHLIKQKAKAGSGMGIHVSIKNNHNLKPQIVMFIPHIWKYCFYYLIKCNANRTVTIVNQISALCNTTLFCCLEHGWEATVIISATDEPLHVWKVYICLAAEGIVPTANYLLIINTESSPYIIFTGQWNLPWDTTATRDHLSWKTRSF